MRDNRCTYGVRLIFLVQTELDDYTMNAKVGSSPLQVNHLSVVWLHQVLIN